MTYTLKTFFDNLKLGFVENAYCYLIYVLLYLYWVYSTNWLYNRSVVIGNTLYETILVTGFFAIIVTFGTFLIYCNTNDFVTNWLKNKVES